MSQDRAAEIIMLVCGSLDAVSVVQDALAAAHEEGRREGLEEAAVYLLGKAAGSHSREERHAFAIRALADEPKISDRSAP